MNLAGRRVGQVGRRCTTRKLVASDLFTWNPNIPFPLKVTDRTDIGHNLHCGAYMRWGGTMMCIYVLHVSLRASWVK